MYDQVPVVDRVHGIEVIADVHRVAWDCLLERMEEVELATCGRAARPSTAGSWPA